MWQVIIIVTIVLIVGSIVLPVLMIYIQYRWRKIGTLFNILMVLSVIVLGDIAAISLFRVIRDDMIFMTTIHAVFLNPLFLAAGAYIGVYTIFRLMLLSGKEW